MFNLSIIERIILGFLSNVFVWTILYICGIYGNFILGLIGSYLYQSVDMIIYDMLHK